MTTFLFWIGLYNLLGAVLLMTFHSEKIGDSVLRKATEIIGQPFKHGAFGKMWMWWAASGNLFLGAVMLLATRWESSIQKEIISLVLLTYLIMYLVMLIGGKKPTFGRGIYVTHLLWIAQIGWGAYVILN